MRASLALGLFSVSLSFSSLIGGPAMAATANCMSPDGSCEVSNDFEDTLSCMCADGSGGGMVGGMAWAGLSEMELQLVCDDQLALFCGAPPPPPGIPCGTASGDCVISNTPEDFISCECADGSGFGFGGGNAWAGLSDMELVDVCEDVVDMECGAPPPPPPGELECGNDLGTCTITNDPADFIECACANGLGFGGGGGNEWAGLSEEELLMVCEMQLEEGCTEGGETEGETGEPGETEGDTEAGGDTDGATSGGSTGGEGLDSGEEGGSTGTEPGTTGGEGATDGDTEGASGGAGDDGSSKGCSVTAAPAPSWALVLLGLLGLGRRRRRAA
ncbi:MYXO-CTERM sorting domain-containing protein [Paraliomyxa miuraensis]|uniref:MYXO-CTERM sorting domain-containing protein n=1 Tax=Paraliomyxa miuraensis TaxID=376150 RepID=UPI002253A405|nr:MYXO-CTERM sorting domain-containing protein [Paraliomyxa miuraensis]MCX4246076.1 MYXO-CTERM sorting domain-containing protein [Paraliomyxa miuraensis]